MLSHSYVCVTFLIMYGTMRTLDMKFDTRLFAVASCLIHGLEIAVIEFGVGVHNFVHYLTGAKRMRVCFIDNST